MKCKFLHLAVPVQQPIVLLKKRKTENIHDIVNVLPSSGTHMFGPFEVAKGQNMWACEVKWVVYKDSVIAVAW